MDRSIPSLSLLSTLPRWAGLAAGALALALLSPGEAQAQETYTFTVAALGGIGGSVDADVGDELDNSGFQLDLGMVIQPSNHLVLRLGKLGLDSAGQFEDLTDADLTYATIGGEYRYRHSYYDSGVYLALGGYRLEGTGLAGKTENETAVGLALGVTGDFPIRSWLAVQVELSGHYVDFDRANLYAMGHAGLAIHF
jgi:hypothetical protein